MLPNNINQVGNDYFKFKEFTVYQKYSVMRVNTDGVILGAWMQVLSTDKNLLDVGTGTGIIALMAAQRLEKACVGAEDKSGIAVCGIDSDAASCSEAKTNFAESKWTKKLFAENAEFQTFATIHKNQFDLVFSNPPYFTDSLKSSNKKKSSARHNDILSQADLIKGVTSCLKEGGRFALILPTDEAEIFLKKVQFLKEHFSQEACSPFLQLSRKCNVFYKRHEQIKRVMMEFLYTRVPADYRDENLTIQNETGYTTEYKNLTKDFYLAF